MALSCTGCSTTMIDDEHKYDDAHAERTWRRTALPTGVRPVISAGRTRHDGGVGHGGSWGAAGRLTHRSTANGRTVHVGWRARRHGNLYLPVASPTGSRGWRLCSVLSLLLLALCSLRLCVRFSSSPADTLLDLHRRRDASARRDRRPHVIDPPVKPIRLDRRRSSSFARSSCAFYGGWGALTLQRVFSWWRHLVVSAPRIRGGALGALHGGRNGTDAHHRDAGVVGDHADRDADSRRRRKDVSRVEGHLLDPEPERLPTMSRTTTGRTSPRSVVNCFSCGPCC